MDIRLRPAVYGDLVRIGHVAGRAFFDDNILGDMVHPHKGQFPNDMDLYWSRRARVNFWDYRWKQVVATCHDDKGNDVVVGIAQWERFGRGGKGLELSRFDPRTLVRPLASFAMKIGSFIWPNRAADPEKEDILERAYPFLEGCWSGERAESWYLELLAVHPDFQGKGIGRMLVHNGFEQSDSEGVWTSVISTKGKESFYQKCGFDIEDGHVGMGEGNPLAGADGGRMFWRLPKIQKGALPPDQE